MQIGDTITGKVSGIKPYGIFISFDNTFGFCHISNISKKFISDISALYTMGQEVKAKIIQIDENNRINLSIKELELEVVQKVTEPIENKRHKQSNINNKPPKKQSFDDMLDQFLKSSDDKIKSINNRNKKHAKR